MIEDFHKDILLHGYERTGPEGGTHSGGTAQALQDFLPESSLESTLWASLEPVTMTMKNGIGR